jgi:hypothetical protein
MILEGLVTTLDADGTPHLAPMGPTVEGPDFASFVLRPFATSHTGQNLARTRQGVLHITDDALLLAKAAIGRAAIPPHRPAVAIDGAVLLDHCRALEFRITTMDDSAQRWHMTATVVHSHRGRDWFGFHRARHAVLEAAILATRFHLLPADEVAREFARLKVIVDKTAGPAELEAFALLDAARCER